ncbi:putative sorting nexin-4 [Clavispora lusitaniae]|uniref:Sorting nexin-4 n=1 Tax=Clavispora lusitaniae TaxID=36911 RepID=A0AA91PW95_CLALS|nr:intercellular trafficking and secretion [Clavispora lusitaniae]OVF06700.1 putative sorting nexin-4 [Clavispora lusitaniae]
MSDDPFTSVQWDRDDKNNSSPRAGSPIEEEPSASLLLAGDAEDTSDLPPSVPDEPFEAAHEPTAANSEPAPPEYAEKPPSAVGKSPTPKTSPEPQANSGEGEHEQTTEVEAPAASAPVPTEILDQKRMEEQFQKYKISSHVSHPLSDRDSNSKPYISYLVTTETNHPEVIRLSEAAAGTEFVTVKTRRRYGDFRFLHNCLINDFPQLLVPPLPAKSNFKYLTGDTFSTSFVHKRLNSLDRFISFICGHKLLSQSSVFHFFVSDSGEWATFTKNLKISKGDDSDASIVGKVANEEMLTETLMNFFTSSKHKRETNKDILEISDKLKKLCENLIRLDKIFSRLNRKNYDMKTDYDQLSTQITKLAAVQNLTSQLNDNETSENTSSHETSDAMVSNFKIFSESLMFFSNNWADLHRYIDESFLVTLKDCAKYIGRFSDLIEFQHNKRIDLQVLHDYLAKAKTEYAALGGPQHTSAPNPVLVGHASGGIVNNTTQLIKDTLSTSATPHIGSSHTDTKRVRAQQKIQQLEAEITSQTQLVNNLTSRIINEEYPNWEQFNKRQLKQSMTELCDHEITFYKGLVDNWSDVETKLMKRLDELKT